MIQDQLHRISHLGVDGKTPSHLVDRLIFFNSLCLVALGVDLLTLIPNALQGHQFLVGLNIVFFLTLVTCLALNDRHRFLASRILFLTVTMTGLALTAASTGAKVQNEHYLLVECAFCFPMFHSSERRYSLFFSLLGAIAYVVLVNIPDPLFYLDQSTFSTTDRYLNEFFYVALFMLALNSLSKAYDKAAKLIEAQHQKLLEQARMTSVGSIASRVAHEMNSPLTALELQLYKLRQSLAPSTTPPATLERLDKIQRLSSRISVLVKGINYLSRKESIENPTQMGLSQIIESALEIAGERLRQAGIAIDVDLSNSGAVIQCRPIAFSQVILNLVNNSIDALEESPQEGRWIRIRSRIEAGALEVSVTDSGSTPSERIREKMFEPFFTTKPLGRGTGLGLSVSRQVVREQGGDLFLDEASLNTRIVVRMPTEAQQ